MLSQEDNRALTEVGQGTPVGNLLRRYWHPIAAVAELEDRPTKAVRFLGEDFVLYKDQSGHYGLSERYCAHRRFDLSYGMVQDCGIRCPYHGWAYDRAGNCIEQPFEETARPGSTYKDRIKLKSGLIEAKGGLLWAYLGPDPAPLVPNWEPFTWSHGVAFVYFAEVPCNWVQLQENSIDPLHFEWLHLNLLRRLHQKDAGPPAPRHLKLRFEEFEYGFRYGRVVEGESEIDESWTLGRLCLWPNAFYTGAFAWCVPIDDRTTLSVNWIFVPAPAALAQKRIPYSHLNLKDKDGQWVIGDVAHQDLAACASQGAIVDRSREHLGEGDRGIIMMRKKLIEQAKVVSNGGEPFGLIRDPGANACIPLPVAGGAALSGAAPSNPNDFNDRQLRVLRRHLITGLSPETENLLSEAGIGRRPVK